MAFIEFLSGLMPLTAEFEWNSPNMLTRGQLHLEGDPSKSSMAKMTEVYGFTTYAERVDGMPALVFKKTSTRLVPKSPILIPIKWKQPKQLGPYLTGDTATASEAGQETVARVDGKGNLANLTTLESLFVKFNSVAIIAEKLLGSPLGSLYVIDLKGKEGDDLEVGHGVVSETQGDATGKDIIERLLATAESIDKESEISIKRTITIGFIDSLPKINLYIDKRLYDTVYGPIDKGDKDYLDKCRNAIKVLRACLSVEDLRGIAETSRSSRANVLNNINDAFPKHTLTSDASNKTGGLNPIFGEIVGAEPAQAAGPEPLAALGSRAGSETLARADGRSKLELKAEAAFYKIYDAYKIELKAIKEYVDRGEVEENVIEEHERSMSMALNEAFNEPSLDGIKLDIGNAVYAAAFHFTLGESEKILNTVERIENALEEVKKLADAGRLLDIKNATVSSGIVDVSMVDPALNTNINKPADDYLSDL